MKKQIPVTNSEESRLPDFLDKPVNVVAKKLLGCTLERRLEEGIIRVRIVETESYDQDDEASHAFGGPTKRNQTMFGPAGRLYVYFTYGMHYCCNVVTGSEGYGSGVLIRAVEPVEGLEIIEKRRGTTGYNITNGPGKVCQALGIDFALRGHDLSKPPMQLFEDKLQPGEKVVTSTRIGISKAREHRRRYYIAGNRYVSRSPHPPNS